jgi:hypothetical protein
MKTINKVKIIPRITMNTISPTYESDDDDELLLDFFSTA